MIRMNLFVLSIVLIIPLMVMGEQSYVRLYAPDDCVDFDTIPFMVNDYAFEQSYNELAGMLEGKQAYSLKRAEYLVENAYYGNTLDYDSFAGNIVNYRAIPVDGIIGGCIVNNLQDNLGISAPGVTKYVPIDTKNAISAHSIHHMVKYFRGR